MVIIFGPAGSGKSVQGQILAARQSWRWLSMGQLLRDTPDEEVHEFQRQGVLVPIAKVNQVLGDALTEAASVEKLLLDGYPRRMDQAQWLLDKCAALKIPITLAINFDVDLEELLKRMQLRGRDDDTPEAINERLAIYNSESSPIFELYAKNGTKIVHVNGVGSIEEIHDRVMKELVECKLA